MEGAGRREGPLVALSTASVYPEKTAQGFELAARLGYDAVEVMVGIDPVSQDIKAVKHLSEYHEIPICAVHAPCLLITQRVWGTEPWGKLERSAEMARAVGADVVVPRLGMPATVLSIAPNGDADFEGIVAWAQTRQTNGFLEAINGLFQAAKRKARGYSRPSTIRSRTVSRSRLPGCASRSSIRPVTRPASRSSTARLTSSTGTALMSCAAW